MRFAAKSDTNQLGLMDAARQMGAYVFDVHRLGAGFVDLVVAYQGRTLLVEVKHGKGKLTAAERDFHNEMSQAGVKIYIWHDVVDVVRDLTRGETADLLEE